MSNNTGVTANEKKTKIKWKRTIQNETYHIVLYLRVFIIAIKLWNCTNNHVSEVYNSVKQIHIHRQTHTKAYQTLLVVKIWSRCCICSLHIHIISTLLNCVANVFWVLYAVLNIKLNDTTGVIISGNISHKCLHCKYVFCICMYNNLLVQDEYKKIKPKKLNKENETKRQNMWNIFKILELNYLVLDYYCLDIYSKSLNSYLIEVHVRF